MSLREKLMVGTIIAATGLTSLVGCDDQESSKNRVNNAQTQTASLTPINPVVEQDTKEKPTIKYSDRFETRDKERLKNWKIKPEIANAYHKNFLGWPAVMLMRNNIESKIANQYAEIPNNHPGNIINFIEGNVPPAVAAKFQDLEFSLYRVNFQTGNSYRESEVTGFTAEQIVKLHNKGVLPEKAAEYDGLFSRESVIVLIENEIDAKEANIYAALNHRYGTFISAYDILGYKEEGIPFSEVEQQAKKSWLKRSLEE